MHPLGHTEFLLACQVEGQRSVVRYMLLKFRKVVVARRSTEKRLVRSKKKHITAEVMTRERETF
jgi:hypothetical protein